jgi:hypothetical protein
LSRPTRAALTVVSLLLAFALPATAAQAVTPSYGVAADTATLTPVDPILSTAVFGDGIDDANAVVTAPFAVSLYGVSDTQLSVGSNGYVGIGATTAQNNGGDDTLDWSTPVIAPYFTDLGTGDDGGVRTETRGTVPNRSFVVQWDVGTCCVGPVTGRFQVIFAEGSDQDVQVLYGGTMPDVGWVGAKLDPDEFIRPGADNQAYPVGGTRLTYSPGTPHLTAAVPARDDATPTITGTTDDLTEDVDLNVFAGTDTSVAAVTTLAATPDPITGEYTATVADLDALDAGAYTVVAGQPTDGHGKTREAFDVDTTAPSGLTLTGPAARVADATPAFGGTAGTATDDQAPTVEIYDGTTVTGSPEETITATGSPTYAATSSGLADGTYTARSVQLDDVGNEADSTPLTFTIDTAAPEPFFPRNPTRDNATPYFSGFGGGETGDDATVTVDVYAGQDDTGTRVQQHTGLALDADGRFGVQATALAEGQYTVYVVQDDDVANSGTDAYTFTVDATAPTVTVAAPADGAQTVDATPLFAGTATRAVGDDDVVVVLYAGTDTSVEPAQFIDATVAGNGTWSQRPDVALAAGAYTVQVFQNDDVGNQSMVQRTLTILAPPAAAPVPAPVVAPVPPPAVTPKPPVAVCKSTRLLHKKLDRPRGTRLRVTATLNGRKVKAIINGDGISVTVDLRGKRKGTYKLKVSTTRRQATGKHKTITSTRTFTYKVCL